MSIKTSVLSLLGKQVLDLETGRFLGFVIDAYFDENKSISGFGIVENDALTTSFVAFSQVKYFHDDVVVLSENKLTELVEGKSLFNIDLVTIQGKLIGATRDMAVDSEGKLQEVLIEKATEEGASFDYVTFCAEYIEKIGQEVIITNKVENELIFEKPDSDLYQDLESGKRKSEYVELLFKKLSTSIEDISIRVKNLDKEAVTQEFNKLASSINHEVSKLFDGVIDKLNLRKKSNFDTDIDAIFRDLGGKTVQSSICNIHGETIILPGQVISVEKIEQVIENNALAELYRLATDFENEVTDITIEEE